MGKIKRFFWLLMIGVATNSFAADTTINYTLHKSIKGNFTSFSLDNLGNIYLVTANNQIKKMNANFDSVAVFNDVRRFGKISLIDASNPLKILVYYKDFATIVVLDRFLDMRNSIDLRSQNILQVKTIAQSYDNIWLFDELNASIKKVDENGKVLLTSADFRMLFDEVPNPSTIIDANGQLYLYNTKNGWLVFDYYGALKNKYAIINWQDVQVINNTLTGRTEKQLVISRPQTLSITNYNTNFNISKALKILHNRDFTYVLTTEGIDIYKQY
jgi:hypothetical protein